MYPEISRLQKDDKYGAADRLEAMISVLRGRDLGEAVDLGGNAGYFCLSLIDAGLMKKATVYDVSANALAAGRIMARQMGIEDKIKFVEQSLDLEFLRRLKPVDTALCLNLLHHAGPKFDSAYIEREGWGNYTEAWLAEMRTKSDLAIVGMGFEPKKPQDWDAPHPQRPARFADLAEQAGWSLVYDANVKDLQMLGIEGANGRYTTGGMDHHFNPSSSFTKRAYKKIKRLNPVKSANRALERVMGGALRDDKRQKYHLYIFDAGKAA
jgi:hypothetical protein